MIEETLYTVQEVCDKLKVSKSFVQDLLTKGILKGYYVGESTKVVRIPESAIEGVLAAYREEGSKNE